MKIPLGATESVRQEFKGRDVLSKPATVGRSVVAMLNAKGGTIWIGLAERDGRATHVEAIERIEEQKALLRNHLLDTIEPRLQEEIDIAIVQHADGALLAVQVNPRQAQRPYAQLKQSGRYFYRRVQDRTRDMTRDELRTDFCSQSDDNDETRAQVGELIQQHSNAETRHGFWCWVRPVPSCGIDLMVPNTRAELERLLRSPEVSGNRSMGWNVTSPYYEFKSNGQKLEASVPTARVIIHNTGDIDCWLALETLRWKEQGDVLYPYALLELPTSLLRVAAAMLRTFADPGIPIAKVVADLALFGLRGWGLRRGSPQSPFFYMRELARYETAHFESPPKVFSSHEFMDAPDSCAFSLVREVYGAFGYTDADLPVEFDALSGRLMIPG